MREVLEEVVEVTGEVSGYVVVIKGATRTESVRSVLGRVREAREIEFKGKKEGYDKWLEN